MEADYLSGSCPQKVIPGHEFSVAIKRESVTIFTWTKLSTMSRSNIWSAGAFVHQDSKIRYLSNDTFGSSTTFNRKDCPFGVSFNNLNDRWKQTIFSSSCPQKVFPGHEFSVAIKRESPTTFVWKIFNFFASFYSIESRGKKTVTLLIVVSHVHWGTKIWYLSNDSLKSSTTFIPNDCPFGVSFNKHKDR